MSRIGSSKFAIHETIIKDKIALKTIIGRHTFPSICLCLNRYRVTDGLEHSNRTTSSQSFKLTVTSTSLYCSLPEVELAIKRHNSTNKKSKYSYEPSNLFREETFRSTLSGTVSSYEGTLQPELISQLQVALRIFHSTCHRYST